MKTAPKFVAMKVSNSIAIEPDQLWKEKFGDGSAVVISVSTAGQVEYTYRDVQGQVQYTSAMHSSRFHNTFKFISSFAY